MKINLLMAFLLHFILNLNAQTDLNKNNGTIKVSKKIATIKTSSTITTETVRSKKLVKVNGAIGEVLEIDRSYSYISAEPVIDSYKKPINWDIYLKNEIDNSVIVKNLNGSVDTVYIQINVLKNGTTNCYILSRDQNYTKKTSSIQFVTLTAIKKIAKWTPAYALNTSSDKKENVDSKITLKIIFSM